MTRISEQLRRLIHERPGLSERELAEALLGRGAEQQRVNQDCRALSSAGLVERRGLGGINDPFRYYPMKDGVPPEKPAGTAANIEKIEVPTSPDATIAWFWEGNVVGAIVSFLVAEGWKIEQVADTHSREHGVDIHATKNGKALFVEAKGYPSTGYRDPERAGERKPTNPTGQAQHWYSHALLKVMRLQSKYPDATVAFGLPEFPRYRSLFEETKNGLVKLGAAVLWVRQNGEIGVWGADI